MKILVDSIQMLVVAAMIYPMFYLWDINKVDQFCSEIETGISQQTFLQIADEQSIKIVGGSGGKGKWNSSAVTWSPFTNYSCKVRGYGGLVSNAWIEEA
ncbi:MAG: hypothetical protein GQ547_04420 [Methylophaga sp.]|nr:hypothetical protein [Methylophaga sp.]